MFAFIFRGVFLIGVISWYSTSVWKMIDVYFKNRFQNYLRAEYDKNPHMLADVEAYRAAAAAVAAGGKESPAAPIAEPEEYLDDVVRICSADVCPVSKDEDFKTGEVTIGDKKSSFVDEIDVVKPEIIEATTESPPIIVEDVIKKVVANDPVQVPGERLKNDTENNKVKVEKTKIRRSIVSEKVEEVKKPKKKKLKTITLTEKDFASTRIRVTPQDFAEFDLDEDAVQSTEDLSDYVLVSELPFKPKADIGDLRMVSPQEFCPINLEDEFSCDETKTWP